MTKKNIVVIEKGNLKCNFLTNKLPQMDIKQMREMIKSKTIEIPFQYVFIPIPTNEYDTVKLFKTNEG